ncbi:MAG: hypothetical protein ACR2OL_13595 [Anderseniella sp.]
MPDQGSDKKSGKIEASKGDASTSTSRRNWLVGSGALLAGGIAGRASGTQTAAAEGTTPQEAPDLPWKWAKIDPLEAGSRTYKAYLTQGG